MLNVHTLSPNNKELPSSTCQQRSGLGHPATDKFNPNAKGKAVGHSGEPCEKAPQPGDQGNSTVIHHVNPHPSLSLPVMNDLTLTKTQERPNSSNSWSVFCKSMEVITDQERLRSYHREEPIWEARVNANQDPSWDRGAEKRRQVSLRP